MNAFNQAKEIEKKGAAMIAPLPQKWARSGRLFNNLDAPIETQERDGDFLIIRNGHRSAIEFKTELVNKHGNFYFETMSNINEGFEKVGWVATCQADGLLYLFQESRELYSIPWPRCQAWLKENIRHYPRAEQSKYQQKNQTVGRLVPIQCLLERGLAIRQRF